MAAYQKSLNTLYGHSVNDTIPPADATTKGYYRYDTDKEHYYQNQTGSAWTLILTGPNAVAAFANKTLDLRANTTLRQCRYGVYVPSEESKAVGQGVLAGLVGIGDKGTSTQNTGGKYDVWSTKAVANDCAGVVKLDTFTCWRNANPLLRFAWLYPGNTTNKRMFKGVGAKRLINTDSDTAPLNSNENGFFFGYGSGDTNYQLFHNDATGTCVKVDTGVLIPAIATNYILEIQINDFSGGSISWTLYSVLSNTNIGVGVRNTVLGTGNIATRIPSQTTHLFMQDLVITTSASIQPNNIHHVEVFV